MFSGIYFSFLLSGCFGLSSDCWTLGRLRYAEGPFRLRQKYMEICFCRLGGKWTREKCKCKWESRCTFVWIHVKVPARKVSNKRWFGCTSHAMVPFQKYPNKYRDLKQHTHYTHTHRRHRPFTLKAAVTTQYPNE